MNGYGEDVVYFISYSKLPANTPAGIVNKLLGVGIFVNYKTKKIVGTSCTLLTEGSRDFLNEIIVGKYIDTDMDEIIEDIKFRYNSVIQKAICNILKFNYTNYMEWEEKNSISKRRDE